VRDGVREPGVSEQDDRGRRPERLLNEHADVIRDAVHVVCQQLMEAEVSGLIGAELGERTRDCATHRNGYRARVSAPGENWTACAG
jgi:transposase-like protein